MNKTLRNFWIDIILFLLLGMDMALVVLTPRMSMAVHPGLGRHAHALLSILLTLVCLVHVVLHWQWLQAVLTGKAKGRIKLIMNSLVLFAILLANVSGHGVLESGVASRLHSLTGTCALLGMAIHGLKHTHWMFLTAKRLTSGPRALEQAPSSD